jgi:hypothetical protein
MKDFHKKAVEPARSSKSKLKGREGRRDRSARINVNLMDEDEIDALPERVKIRFDSWSRGQRANLKPMIKWLEKQVGRSWDDVYSEIRSKRCTNFDRMHERMHLLQFIANPDAACWGRVRPQWSNSLRWSDFYIEADGILRKTEGESYPKRKPAYQDWVRTVDGHHLVQIDRIWYEVTLSEQEYETYTIPGSPRRYTRKIHRDVLPEFSKFIMDGKMILGHRKPYMHDGLRPIYNIPSFDHRPLSRGELVALSKRQLNSKEITHFGLREAA